MTYTDDQSRTLEGLQIWSKNSDDLLATLNGAAGTGKTTIVKQFIANLNISSNSVAVTAPTHKAKKVISEATDFPAQTIQKLLGLRPDVNMDNFNPNKPVFNPLAEETIMYFKYVIIDEASMLNKDAFNLVVKKARQYNIKVLFLGDDYQLPPINEVSSKVFTDVETIFTLTTIVRQEATNPMSEVLVMLRKDVRDSTDHAIAHMVRNGSSILGEQGYKCLPVKALEQGGSTFGLEMLQMYLNSEYQHNTEYIKFLTYTNKNLVLWSNALREKLLKEDAKNHINLKEVFTGYSTISDKKSNLIIQNSEDYVVKELMMIENQDGITGYHVKLENTEGHTSTVFIVAPEGLPVFRQIYSERLRIAKLKRGSYWRAFYAFKDRVLLIQDVFDDNNRFLCKKDLYYGYGSTVHKSQGSTYSNTAINVQNLFTNRTITERNRLIYVALSRSKHMNLLLVK